MDLPLGRNEGTPRAVSPGRRDEEEFVESRESPRGWPDSRPAGSRGRLFPGWSHASASRIKLLVSRQRIARAIWPGEAQRNDAFRPTEQGCVWLA
jgi:hypothetical protein